MFLAQKRTSVFGRGKLISVDHYSTDVLPECINSRRRRRGDRLPWHRRIEERRLWCSACQVYRRSREAKSERTPLQTWAKLSGRRRRRWKIEEKDPQAFPTLLLTPGSTKMKRQSRDFVNVGAESHNPEGALMF